VAHDRCQRWALVNSVKFFGSLYAVLFIHDTVYQIPENYSAP
jgi:hypothetical protein